MASAAGLYKRGTTWWYRFTMNGIEYRGSLRTDDLATAKLAVSEVKKDIVLGNFGLKKVPTFSVMAQKWLDTNSNIFSETHIRTAKIFFTKHINPVIGEYMLNRVSTEVVSKMMNDFLANHSNGSGNALRKYLKTVFNYAIELGYLKEIPYKCKKLSIADKERTLLETPDLQPFIEYCFKNHKSKHNQTATMIALALLTGMREVDIRNITWDCFNKDEKKLTYVAKKTGILIKCPLECLIVNILSEYQEASKLSLGLMFPGRKGKPHPRSFIYWAITRLAKKYGLTGPTPFGAHSCRHSFITMHHDIGTPIGDVSKMVGHRRIETTAKYIQPSYKHQREAQDKLATTARLNTRTKTGTDTI